MTTSAAMRQNMIDGQLATNEVTDSRIIKAISDTPREPFLPEGLRGAAYVDDGLEILPGRCTLAPLVFARLIQLAEITPSCRVLVIGCLSGYPAAIIAKLSTTVIAIDSDEAAIAQARDNFKRLNLTNINLQLVKTMKDGYGLSAPYDVIVICGAVMGLSDILGSQLALGGRLVTVRNATAYPGSNGGAGKGLLVKRLDHKLQYREHFDAAASLLPGFERDTHFSF